MSEVRPTFTCFDDAGEFCMRKGGVVVHGLIPEAHAWVELEGHAWQGGIINGKRSFYSIPLDVFYALYTPSKTSRYTRRLFLALWKQHNYPGPWRAEYKARCNEGQVVVGARYVVAPVQVITYEDEQLV